jgi:hypothetical protein
VARRDAYLLQNQFGVAWVEAVLRQITDLTSNWAHEKQPVFCGGLSTKVLNEQKMLSLRGFTKRATSIDSAGDYLGSRGVGFNAR